MSVMVCDVIPYYTQTLRRELMFLRFHFGLWCGNTIQPRAVRKGHFSSAFSQLVLTVPGLHLCM